MMQIRLLSCMRSITVSAFGAGGEGLSDLEKDKMPPPRHLSYRTLFHTVPILAFLLLFMFILTAVLEGVNKCSSFATITRDIRGSGDPTTLLSAF
ncbi:hypothetical protein DsansV1_C09g0093001 [Dioscorea sansibarensis]